MARHTTSNEYYARIGQLIFKLTVKDDDISVLWLFYAPLVIKTSAHATSMFRGDYGLFLHCLCVDLNIALSQDKTSNLT